MLRAIKLFVVRNRNGSIAESFILAHNHGLLGINIQCQQLLRNVCVYGRVSQRRPARAKTLRSNLVQTILEPTQELFVLVVDVPFKYATLSARMRAHEVHLVVIFFVADDRILSGNPLAPAHRAVLQINFFQHRVDEWVRATILRP